MKTPFLLTLTLLHLSSANTTTDPTTKKGWTAPLSTLDAGLSGTITVLDPNKLLITDYTLEDASAPALYWWGTATANLRDGFRVSSKRVDEVASAEMYTIELDVGCDEI
ncbi:hypothetical protein QBC34DRAFT_431062 [Podospora aff. communis PSN243]|uniref:DM13 domain-containing protein n=1 Tax=Podospora aff. communis PSN243 TaxID=3040156 RepID=A0AAV9G4P9_9PEZI|nr:hypothetical protein QBC34DRAFT_431062 [Podospora aff. communis PSN243]